VAFIPELHPPIEQLGICSGSWAQYLNDPAPPGLLHLKWLEPRHAQYQTRRWEASHRGEIETAFFNGSGFMVWENIFGTYNPCPFEDRHLWRRCVRILKRFPGHFSSDSFEPFAPTLNPKVFAHKWPRGDAVLYTLFNAGDPVVDLPVLALDPKPGMLYLDLLNGRRLKEADVAGKTQISLPLEHLGCLLAIPQSGADETLRQFTLDQRTLGELEITEDHRNFALSVVDPKKVKPTKPASLSSPPPGMVPVPATQFHMRFKHMRRECGTYPDPETPKERWKEFLWGSPHDQIMERDFGVVPIKAFFMDEAEVSNAEYKRFLDASGYSPKMTQNFLKHWPNGEMPAELADHPVVYVDLEDARAYAKWAGKRLPTEAEWQLAAQGTDEREWPWGSEFDPSKCNTTGDHTLAVRTLPDGRSPFGCYHMSGNVWEWTESERDDGHVRFAILRGGSYFKAEGSIWYAPGGPLPVTTHAKFLLMAPSLDRCATVGFRCVMDAE
jgi:formylglycine-generating enzyme required for sulfatase activity